jgi:hypothetical protein
MSISAGMYEVTSRPTSCSRTAGFDQTFMTSSYFGKMPSKIGWPRRGPTHWSDDLCWGRSSPRIQNTQVRTAMAAINHTPLGNGSKSVSQTRVVFVMQSSCASTHLRRFACFRATRIWSRATGQFEDRAAPAYFELAHVQLMSLAPAVGGPMKAASGRNLMPI